MYKQSNHYQVKDPSYTLK